MRQQFCAAFSVSIKYARLRTYDKAIAAGFFDPVDVVVHLAYDFFGGFSANFLHYFGCNAVGRLQIFGVAGRTYPTERSKAVVEEHRAHNILYVGRIAELAIAAYNVGPSALTLQQEGITIVEEVHAFEVSLLIAVTWRRRDSCTRSRN